MTYSCTYTYDYLLPLHAVSTLRDCAPINCNMTWYLLTGINEVFQCHFKGNLVGLHLDSAINSVNVLDSNFEHNYGVGLIINSGAMVRVEGSEFEGHGGPAIIAQYVKGLTVRSNYFEANNFVANQSAQLSFVDGHSSASEPLCTDILLNGVYGWHFRPSPGPNDTGLVMGRIPLGNSRLCSGVVIEANYHNPGSDHCPTQVFAAVYAAAAEGLRAEASDCSGCKSMIKERVCTAVATGGETSTSSNISSFRIALNTGDFAESGSQ